MNIAYRQTKSLAWLILLCLCAGSLYCGTGEGDSLLLWKAGIGVGYNINSHQSALHSLPGVPSCAPIISKGSGSGTWLNGYLALPIHRDLCASLGVELLKSSDQLATTQDVVVDVKGAQNAKIEYVIDSDISSFALHPELLYTVGPVCLHAGLQFAFIGRATYRQAERILSPANIMFENNRRDRMNFSGAIDEMAAFTTSATVALSTSFKLNEESSWTAEPKLMYSHMVSNMLATSDLWSIHSVGVGLSISYTSHRKIQVPEIVVPPPPIPVPAPMPIAEAAPPKILFPKLKFAPRLRDSTGIEMDLQFVVKNTISQNTYAMINYVFFDSASSKMASRYKLLSQQEQTRFTTTALNATSTMQIYYNILNLVGYRMKQDPKTRIMLVGCNSGDGAEKNNLDLSRARAESIKSYLCDTWKVEPARVAVSARNLPESASNSSTLDGIQENRRVEIRTESTELLEPLIFSDTACTLNAAKVLYPGNVNSEITVSSWLLTIVSNDKVITTQGDRGTPPGEIVWDTEIDREQIRQAKGSLKAILKVIDTDGKEYSAESDAMEIKQQRVRNSTIQRFSLITFAFNASTVSKADRHIIEIIKQHIQPKSTVFVSGYTDRVGEAEHNQQLSEQRAKQVARLLHVDLEHAKGEGAENPLYDNSTPEGRFYSRTVIVTIETPLE